TSRTFAGDTGNAADQYTLDLSVPVLLGGKRKHRTAAANAHVAATRAEVALTQGDSELEIRAHFADLLAAQEQTSVLTTALADARTLRDIVAGRSSAGAGSAYAVERIDLAIASLASRVDTAKADEAAASGVLATAVGLPGWHPHAVGDLISTAGHPAGVIDAEHPAL